MSLAKEEIGADLTEHGIHPSTTYCIKRSKAFGSIKHNTKHSVGRIERARGENDDKIDAVCAPITITLPPRISENNDNNREQITLPSIENTEVDFGYMTFNSSASKGGLNNYGFAFGQSSLGNHTRRSCGNKHTATSTESSEPMKTLKYRKSSKQAPVMYKTNTFSVTSETQTIHSSDYQFINKSNHIEPQYSRINKHRRRNSIS